VFRDYIPLREDGHLVLTEIVLDVRSTIFGGEGGSQLALYNDIKLCTAIVNVRSVEAAWAKKAQCH